MMRIPGPAVGVASVILIGSAALGAYLGYNRAAAASGASPGEASVNGASKSGVAAKAAIPVPDSAPPAAVPDEAFIRKIAREELQAALHPKRAAAPVEDNSDSSDDQETKPDASRSAAPPSSTPVPAAPASSPPPAPLPQ